ncbi:MAG: thermonuclease family protein [Lentisphaeria bacterium]|nr:thermonuclease family protein [Lentisphaeria bacterium]
MRLLLTYLLLACSLVAAEKSFTGKVVRVLDGDTIVVLVDEKQIKVRFAHIDTPEKAQAFGNQAKKALSAKIFGKQVRIQVDTIDRYGRSIGNVYLDKRWINQEMITEGWAWHYKTYSKDEKLAALEQKAKEANLGLWADAKAVAPWNWRKKKPSKTTTKTQPDKAVTSYWLNTKSNTRHNNSCKWFNKTKKGRLSTAKEGKACGSCGG